MLDFLSIQASTVNANLMTIIYTYLLCFALSSLNAFTYQFTFRGLSFSRNYVQSLVLSSIVACTVIQAIGDSLGRGLGMIGALAIIRFRTNFKDPKDIIFMFASLAIGISCGVYGFKIAIVGTGAFLLASYLLYYMPFVDNVRFDGVLRFNIENDNDKMKVIETNLKEHCKLFTLVTLRDMAQGNRLDFSYQIKMKKANQKSILINKLMEIDGIKGINLMLHETTVEI